MQPLFLRSDVHLTTVGDDLVSLDVAAGQYACLPALGAVATRLEADGRLRLEGAEAELVQAAGLAAEQPRELTAPLPPPAAASCWRATRVPTTGADRRRFAAAWLAQAPRYWRMSFPDLIEATRRERPLGSADTSATFRDAQVFAQLAPLAPFQGECLYRSFLLLGFLRLAGRDATWMFGVRTYPFQAHCWLQLGATVLDDAVERICGYVPILAV